MDGLTLEARSHEPVRHLGDSGAEVDDPGVVLLVHGISVDLDEGGMYGRLAARLADSGYAVLQFSFRGHGASGGTQRGITIAGEVLDVEAAAAEARSMSDGSLAIVASSFGAVAVLEAFPFLRPSRLVLWNPVLDLRRTFVEPELPWGRENFSASSWREAMETGVLRIDGEFEIGRTLLGEMTRYHPGDRFRAVDVPALVVHGDRDSYVSYPIARQAALEVGCDFHTVEGSDHGFDSREREDEAISVTTSWLRDRAHTMAGQ